MKTTITLGTWDKPSGPPKLTRPLATLDLVFVPAEGDVIEHERRGFQVVTRVFKIDGHEMTAMILVRQVVGAPAIVVAPRRAMQ